LSFRTLQRGNAGLDALRRKKDAERPVFRTSYFVVIEPCCRQTMTAMDSLAFRPFVTTRHNLRQSAPAI
ncbi:DUF1534 domain-containing protein, partial [Pseudomonas savastanoi]|uniref:DUF1534 domain-containing protein n=6 Tax=Pseudomonas syringae group genomosp. 2 TaxID=251698 RepID=UPI000F001FF2